MADPGVVRTTAVPRVLTHEPAKATIVNTFTRESFGVMYNPDELKLEQGNTFAEVGVPGLGTPPVQYVRGKARILSMELFFDSYEEGTDVRRLTSPSTRAATRPCLSISSVEGIALGGIVCRNPSNWSPFGS